MRLARLCSWSVCLSLVGVIACQPDSPTTSPAEPSLAVASSSSKYVISVGSGVSDLATAVQRAGGTLKTYHSKAGVAIALSDDAQFATKLKAVAGIEAVGKDKAVQWLDPSQRIEQMADEGVSNTFFGIQWAPKAISAPQAWATGAMGAGARVAVLDGGIYSAHPDIAPNLDAASSASMVPGQPYNNDTGTFWHGTHVAGIVAAADNNVGVIGIAPQATIIGVKVLHAGTGEFEWVIDGIIYAATPKSEGGAGANIINMSLGADFNRVDPGFTEENSHLLNALSKATSYARGRGVLVIASAGNDAINFDGGGSYVTVPAMSVGVVAVSALGPEGFALNFSNNAGVPNYDELASYSNSGSSLISFGGPGGDARLPGEDLCTMPLPGFGTITNRCWVFDLVLSSSRGTTAAGGYSWAAGTSMAAPAVAGVAALIVGKYGIMSPAQLETRLRSSADDLGKPGQDDVYGRGRINALRAVQ
jgi:lantibiotic leader peptide-processing serine protease